MDQGLEHFLSMVRENASSVLQFAVQFKECEKDLEIKEVSLRKKEMELKEKEERVKEKERKLDLLENSITEKRKESEAERFLEADLTRFVVEIQVKEVVNQLTEKEKSLGLLQDSTVKKHEEVMRELEAKKEAVVLLEVSMEKKHEALMRKLEALKEEAGLVEDSLAKKNEGLVKELEGWKEEVGLLSKSIYELSSELEIEMDDYELNQKEESERWRKVAEVMETSIKKLEAMKEEVGLLSISIDEKSSALVMEVMEFDLKKTAESEKRKEEAEKLDAKEKELNSLNERVKKNTIKLKKKEKKFKLKLKSEIKRIIEKKKFLVVKESELKESLNKLKLKQRDFEEERSKTQKRSRLEFGASSSIADPDYLYFLGKKHKHNHNGEKKSKETDLALATEGGKTSSVPAAKQTSEAERREVVDIVCLDPEPINCPDPDFHEFSNTMSSFAEGQMWALYDPIDDMPRYYAQINTVSEPHLSVTWLESVHDVPNEKLLPIACGRFKKGVTSEDKSHLMFSHEMNPILVEENFFVINPLIGETWALFRDWKKTWNTTHKELHKLPYKYDFVEVESEFDEVHGIAVAYLGRVEGFTSVYQQAEQHGFIRRMISPDDMFRFSHKVPSFKLTGDEKEGVPAGSFELDPAALPRGFFGEQNEETIVLD